MLCPFGALPDVAGKDSPDRMTGTCSVPRPLNDGCPFVARRQLSYRHRQVLKTLARLEPPRAHLHPLPPGGPQPPDLWKLLRSRDRETVCAALITDRVRR